MTRFVIFTVGKRQLIRHLTQCASTNEMSISLSSCILLLTNASLTFLSIYWSVTAWLAFRAARAEQPWILSNCTVASKAAKNRSFSFCPTLVVTNFTNPPPEPTEAYRYGFPIYNESRASAEEFLNKYAVNETYECWLSPPPDVSVSLTSVPYGPDTHDINLAAISTVLALAAAASFTAVTYLLLVTTHSPPIEDFITPPAMATTSGLSMRAIDAILAEAKAADAGCPTAVEDTCAICLECGLGAKLTCGHRFHPGCIQAWLARGGETCPLCCASIRPPMIAPFPGHALMLPRDDCHDALVEHFSRVRAAQSGEGHRVHVMQTTPIETLVRHGRHSAPADLLIRSASTDTGLQHAPAAQPRSLRSRWNNFLAMRRVESRDGPPLFRRIGRSVPLRSGRSVPRHIASSTTMATAAVDDVDEDEDEDDVLHEVDLSDDGTTEVRQNLYLMQEANDDRPNTFCVGTGFMEGLRSLHSRASKKD